MPENPNQPDPPASGDLPPERPAAQPPPPPRADETSELAEPAPAGPPGPTPAGRTRRIASHRATPIAAAALAGVLVGGGVMALIAYTGDDDDRDGRPGRVEMFRDGPRSLFDDDRPRRADPLRKHERGWIHERLKDRLERMPIPDHRHDEDGNVIPAPREDPGSGEEGGGN
ncbi:MAG: hypothetical protein ACRDQB_17880 [Thermocrispum sp.]